MGTRMQVSGGCPQFLKPSNSPDRRALTSTFSMALTRATVERFALPFCLSMIRIVAGVEEYQTGSKVTWVAELKPITICTEKLYLKESWPFLTSDPIGKLFFCPFFICYYSFFLNRLFDACLRFSLARKLLLGLWQGCVPPIAGWDSNALSNALVKQAREALHSVASNANGALSKVSPMELKRDRSLRRHMRITKTKNRPTQTFMEGHLRQ